VDVGSVEVHPWLTGELMANKFYSEQIHGKAKTGSGPSPGLQSGSGTTEFKVKQGWSDGLPGKAGPDRSGGVKKAKVYSSSEGL
jgi:hypothetical protein